MEKITYMGKPIRDQRGKFSTGRWMKVGMSLCLFTIGAAVASHSWVAKELVATNVSADSIGTELAAQIMEHKIKAAQDTVLDELAGCETKGVKEPDATIILDTNAQMSIGAWQYQIKTIQHYVKQFTGNDISRVDAISLAIDHARAKELTRTILFQEGGYSNWANCAKKLDTKTKVEIINSLSK
jgi:hypothetical protein